MKIPLSTISSLAAELHLRLSGKTISAVQTLAGQSGFSLSTSSPDDGLFLCLPISFELFIPFLCHHPLHDHHPQTLATAWEPKIVNHVIRSIGQWRDDRILRIELEKSSEIHGLLRRTLILELVPRRQNIVLLNPDNNVIQMVLRRIDSQISRTRQVLPGRPYQPPPLPPGWHPSNHRLEEFESTLQSAPYQTLREMMKYLFPWACPYLFGELWPGDPAALEQKISRVNEDQLRSLWTRLAQWTDQLQKGPLKPTVIFTSDGRPDWLLPYDPKTVPGTDKRTFETISQALQWLFRKHASVVSLEEVRRTMLSQLNRTLHRHRRALKNLKRDLEGAQRAAEYRRAGETLIAHLSGLRKGLTEADLPDPYSSSGEQVHISLDPRLSPAENAQRYFQRHRKAKVGLPKIQLRFQQVCQQTADLETLRNQLKEATNTEQLKQLREIFYRLGIPTPAPHSRPASSPTKKETRPRTFSLPDGWTVLVGRNNKDNDELTHRVARPDDVWFHAQGVPGSHVILRQGGHKDNPSKHILELTAGLAAHFSRARHSSTVSVIYTQKRYVRKPKGAKAGSAVVEREKTLFVAPLSPERLLEEMK